MTKIRTTCTVCGVVDLTVEDVRLEPGRYRFDCPHCGATQRHPATSRTADILVTAGVDTSAVDPITEDEIDRFVAALGTRGGEMTHRKPDTRLWRACHDLNAKIAEIDRRGGGTLNMPTGTFSSGLFELVEIPDPQAQSAGDLVTQAQILHGAWNQHGNTIEQIVRDIVESWLSEWMPGAEVGDNT